MSRLPYLRRDDLDEAGRQVWDGVVGSRPADLVGENGGLIGPFNAVVHAPGVGRRLSSLGATLRFKASIERRLSELAIITVAARWKAEFEWFAHSPMAREHGLSEAVDERVVYAVARELATTGRLDQASYEAARRLLGDEGMVELVSLCGYYTLISYLLNAFEVPLPPGATPMWAQG
jgi:4-carboxymuconolactone decarboxylase